MATVDDGRADDAARPQKPTRRLSRDEAAKRLASPTLGAVRRQHPAVEGRSRVTWQQTCEMTTNLQRRQAIEDLDGILRFTAAGASPVAVATRLRALAARLEGTSPTRERSGRQSDQHMADDVLRRAADNARGGPGVSR